MCLLVLYPVAFSFLFSHPPHTLLPFCLLILYLSFCVPQPFPSFSLTLSTLFSPSLSAYTLSVSLCLSAFSLSFFLPIRPLSFFSLLTLYLSLSLSLSLLGPATSSFVFFLPFYSALTSSSFTFSSPCCFISNLLYCSFCRNSAANFEVLRGRYFPGAEGLMDTELLMKHMVGSQQQQQQQQQHGAQDTEPFSLGDLRHCRQDAEDIIMENRY